MSQSEMWNLRYGEETYAYGKAPNDFLKENIQSILKGKVLSLAEGEGRNAVFMATQGYQVTGVDYSEAGLEKARRLAEENGVVLSLEQHDLSDYTINPESWQGIVAIFCHLPRPIRKRLHRDCVAGLVPGGCFLLEAYAPGQLAYGTGGPKNLDLLMDLNEVVAELDGLQFEQARQFERDIYEGDFHRGKGLVIQIIGRKE